MMSSPVAPPGATLAISFQSDEEVLRKLRDKLRKMSDEELIRFGKELRRLAENPFQRQLEEASKSRYALELFVTPVTLPWRTIRPTGFSFHYLDIRAGRLTLIAISCLLSYRRPVEKEEKGGTCFMI
jgi:hypothetical protein